MCGEPFTREPFAREREVTERECTEHSELKSSRFLSCNCLITLKAGGRFGSSGTMLTARRWLLVVEEALPRENRELPEATLNSSKLPEDVVPPFLFICSLSFHAGTRLVVVPFGFKSKSPPPLGRVGPPNSSPFLRPFCVCCCRCCLRCCCLSFQAGTLSLLEPPILSDMTILCSVLSPLYYRC